MEIKLLSLTIKNTCKHLPPHPNCFSSAAQSSEPLAKPVLRADQHLRGHLVTSFKFSQCIDCRGGQHRPLRSMLHRKLCKVGGCFHTGL